MKNKLPIEIQEKITDEFLVSSVSLEKQKEQISGL